MMRGECTREKLKLEYEYPPDFTLCVWQTQRRVRLRWVIYRGFIWLIYFVGMSLFYLAPEKDTPWYKVILFWDQWMFCANVLAFFFAFVVVVQRYRVEKKNPEEPPPLEKMPCLYKILWLLYTISMPAVITMCVFFWAFVYNPVTYADLGYKPVSHILQPIYAVLDFSLSAFPHRLLHFYMIVICLTTYGIFTYVYQYLGGTGTKDRIPVYDLVDWRNPFKATATCVSVVLVTLAIHCALCFLAKMKHICRTQREEELL